MGKVYHFVHRKFIFGVYTAPVRKGETNMKTVWKWVIGIVIGLIVVALVVGGVFLLRSHLPAIASIRVNRPVVQGYGPGRLPFRGAGPGNRGWNMGPRMMGFGMFPLGAIFAGLFGIGLLALLVLGIVWLAGGFSNSKTVTTAPMQAAPAPMLTCKHCGKPVQADWRNCPYCGKKL